MQTWSINLNGKPYSRFYTNLRSQKHEQTIISQWKEQFGCGIPEGTISARPYISTVLDHYGR
jgi:hypothetical protein